MSTDVMTVKRSLHEADLLPASGLTVGDIVLRGDQSLYGFAVQAVREERDGSLRVDLDDGARWFLDPDEDVLVEPTDGGSE